MDTREGKISSYDKEMRGKDAYSGYVDEKTLRSEEIRPRLLGCPVLRALQPEGLVSPEGLSMSADMQGWERREGITRGKPGVESRFSHLIGTDEMSESASEATTRLWSSPGGTTEDAHFGRDTKPAVHRKTSG